MFNLLKNLLQYECISTGNIQNQLKQFQKKISLVNWLYKRDLLLNYFGFLLWYLEWCAATFIELGTLLFWQSYTTIFQMPMSTKAKSLFQSPVSPPIKNAQQTASSKIENNNQLLAVGTYLWQHVHLAVGSQSMAAWSSENGILLL